MTDSKGLPKWDHGHRYWRCACRNGSPSEDDEFIIEEPPLALGPAVIERLLDTVLEELFNVKRGAGWGTRGSVTFVRDRFAIVSGTHYDQDDPYASFEGCFGLDEDGKWFRIRGPKEIFEWGYKIGLGSSCGGYAANGEGR